MILYAKNIYCKVIFYGKNSLSYAKCKVILIIS